MELVLETKGQRNETPVLGSNDGPSLMLTPRLGEGYWLFRVRLSETQAVVGFPKFSTIGIGFAVEEDWNTNLPYRCATEEIFKHIAHNKGGDSIADEDCIRAIEMVRAAARRHRGEESDQ